MPSDRMTPVCRNTKPKTGNLHTTWSMTEKEDKSLIHLPIMRHTIAWCAPIAYESISLPYTAHSVGASIELSEGKYVVQPNPSSFAFCRSLSFSRIVVVDRIAPCQIIVITEVIGLACLYFFNGTVSNLLVLLVLTEQYLSHVERYLGCFVVLDLCFWRSGLNLLSSDAILTWRLHLISRNDEPSYFGSFTWSGSLAWRWIKHIERQRAQAV